MKNTRILKVNGSICKLTLLPNKIKENDFVISKHRFKAMNSFGIYETIEFKPFDVEIEKVILINLGTTNNPEIVLGFYNGGCCDKALQKMYSIVHVELL